MLDQYIFIDGSYYCFYRYHALLQWWKNAHPEEPLNVPFENLIFLEKFKKIFRENIQKIVKVLSKQNKQINKATQIKLIVAKDCKRENIWRNDLFKEYKANRPTDGTFQGSPFFKMVYEDKLFQDAGACAVIHHPQLEADDCIAIYVNHLLKQYKDPPKIHIITSDHDYLQLARENIKIYNLQLKELQGKMETSLYNLNLKIIMGDVSDNIPAIFPKCGIKTAQRCVLDNDFLKKKMLEYPNANAQYKLNQQLVDFHFIPAKLREEFLLFIDYLNSL